MLCLLAGVSQWALWEEKPHPGRTSLSCVVPMAGRSGDWRCGGERRELAARRQVQDCPPAPPGGWPRIIHPGSEFPVHSARALRVHRCHPRPVALHAENPLLCSAPPLQTPLLCLALLSLQQVMPSGLLLVPLLVQLLLLLLLLQLAHIYGLCCCSFLPGRAAAA